MAITLGKNCSVSIDGAAVGARDVSISYDVQTIEINEWMIAQRAKYPIGYSGKITVETIDDADVNGLITNLTGTGSTVSVSAGSISFTGIITSITENTNLNDVRSYTVTAEIGKTGFARASGMY